MKTKEGRHWLSLSLFYLGSFGVIFCQMHWRSARLQPIILQIEPLHFLWWRVFVTLTIAESKRAGEMDWRGEGRTPPPFSVGERTFAWVFTFFPPSIKMCFQILAPFMKKNNLSDLSTKPVCMQGVLCVGRVWKSHPLNEWWLIFLLIAVVWWVWGFSDWSYSWLPTNPNEGCQVLGCKNKPWSIAWVNLGHCV